MGALTHWWVWAAVEGGIGEESVLSLLESSLGSL
jgi:hypothetical protein